MIHDIGRAIEAKIAAKGCPYKVIDREHSKPTTWRNVIVIEETADTYGPPTSQSRNPKRYFDGRIGAKLTVYAKSTKSGALEFEHRRIARKVVDMILVALRTIRAERMVAFLGIGGGRFVPVEDLDASDRQAGAAYELEFVIDRGIADLTWAGEADPEVNIASFSMTGEPTLTFAPDGLSVTRSAGSWVTDGFTAGMTIRFGGAASANGVVIATVSTSVLTFTAPVAIGAGSFDGCTVEAGGTTHKTLVLDSEDDPTPELACGA